MAVHRLHLQRVRPSGRVVRQRLITACLVVVLLLVAAQLLVSFRIDARRNKIQANEIVSPWDRKAVPKPLVRPSRITVKLPPAVSNHTSPDDPAGKGRHHRRWRTRRHARGQFGSRYGGDT